MSKNVPKKFLDGWKISWESPAKFLKRLNYYPKEISDDTKNFGKQKP